RFLIEDTITCRDSIGKRVLILLSAVCEGLLVGNVLFIIEPLQGEMVNKRASTKPQFIVARKLFLDGSFMHEQGSCNNIAIFSSHRCSLGEMRWENVCGISTKRYPALMPGPRNNERLQWGIYDVRFFAERVSNICDKVPVRFKFLCE